jgi:hypothetical protein
MRKNASDCLIGVVAVGSVMFSMGATANPPGVPVADPTPLSCATANYAVTAITGANGEFPVEVQCPTDPTQMCADYGYTMGAGSAATISQTLFAISADQELDSTNPPANIADLGAGDSTTGFLKYTQHEYPIRFNSSQTKSVETHIYIKGISSARSTTAYIRGGKIDESCLIAGPGIPRSKWTPITYNKTVVAAGGQCAAYLHYNGKGDLVNITLPPDSTCFAGKIPPGAQAVIGGEPIQDVNAPDGITFGTGTTTVYLPSGWAVCSATPCPGTTTYKYTY